MSTIIGYSVIEHRDDGTTKVINKVSLSDMTGLLAAAGAPRRGGNSNYLNADACPTHGPWTAVPAGVSKNSGKPYPAFWSCDVKPGEDRCANKPSREWVETHPPEGKPEPVPEPTAPPTATAADFDDLPF